MSIDLSERFISIILKERKNIYNDHINDNSNEKICKKGLSKCFINCYLKGM